MGDSLQVGDLVEYYADKHKVTVVGEVIELPDGHKHVKIRVLKSPLPKLEDQEWFIGHRKLLKAGGDPQPHLGGQPDYSEALLEIRDRVLRELPWDLQPVGYTKRPRHRICLAYDPVGVAYYVHVSPKGLVLKLTLNLEDDEKKTAAYATLQAKEDALRAALGEVCFNWAGNPSRTVCEEITWPGEEGPRPADIDRTVKRLTLFVNTIQPVINEI